MHIQNTVVSDGGFSAGSTNIIQQMRNTLLASVQGSYENLWAYTDASTSYLMGRYTAEEGHLLVNTMGKSFVSMSIPLFNPIQLDSGMFKHLAGEYSPKYESVVIDVNTQKSLLAAGINVVEGVSIPSDPKEPISVGGKRYKPGSIVDSGIFAEGHGTNDFTTDGDRRYFVKTRVPDSVNYHYERQKNDTSIPFLEKMHAQYQRPLAMSDSEFESQLATARYLSGMEPYLSNQDAKRFEHFTYWRYKNTTSADPFRGAYLHIFLSRPDLHLLNRRSLSVNKEFRNDVLANRELASLIFLNPEGALSLVQKWQTKAMTDINLFLSNRACGIDITNETIDDRNFVENFTKINLGFGGRMDNQEGDLNITFNETDDLSVSNTILLWLKYIHMTYTGLLSPLCDGGVWDGSNAEYYMRHMHPIWRRLDSLASLYVIATDMTQQNVIFWRKYFGIYPKSTAYAGLGMESGRMSEGMRTISIPFHYTTFRTNDIADLYAFNRLSDLRTTIMGDNNAYMGNMFQSKDGNVIPEHNVIAGLPFIALENHLSAFVDEYNKQLPGKMMHPLLLFTQTDGAFMPNGTPNEMGNWVNRYWGGYDANISEMYKIGNTGGGKLYPVNV